MTIQCAPGDTVRISAKDVTLLNSTYAETPVTTGLTGTLTVKDWATDATVDGPDALVQSGSSDDWYFDLTAPAVGHYRLVMVLNTGGAQLTKYGELRVEANPPT
jgi:hypothetical protein